MVEPPMVDSVKKLFLILVESELELIPVSIQNHPVIKNYARKHRKNPSQTILDSSFHHKAMHTLKDSHRRGRPDIVHHSLLLALDSQLNREGLLQIYVHTRENKVIWINPLARLPKNYTRFIGLMEQLYEKGTIESETETLLMITDKTLKELLDELNTWNVLLWEKGRDVDVIDFFRNHTDKKLAAMIGGFPHGDFYTASKLSDERIKIGPESYSASTTVAKVIFSYEQALRQTVNSGFIDS
jgi:rRNA small subunit pseudouridine methyltransferase Nep1